MTCYRLAGSWISLFLRATNYAGDTLPISASVSLLIIGASCQRVNDCAINPKSGPGQKGCILVLLHLFFLHFVLKGAERCYSAGLL